MKSFFFITLTAGALASAALGLAGTANAAPSGPSSVDQTVSQLRSQGYQVILNKVGTAPRNQCAVMCSLALLPKYVSVPVTSLPT